MSLTLDSKQEAINYRNEVIALMDDLTETATDEVFNAVQSLRAAVVRDVNERIAQLPAVTVFRSNETVPALVLAYDLYGDIEKETDIINRNHIRHGGFVAGEVEYLK
ncbi:hypothetical protein [Methylophaga sp.]|uniref:hypothetical protein n=1 Tax=Methylophaga sp. TaxID=2024840 RepID=UPI003A92AAD8